MAENETRIDRSVGSETDRRLDALRDLFPEAFVDGGLDVAALAGIATPDATAETGRYGLSWAGKAAAQAALQVGSVATLQPDRDRSRQYDEARNLMIEGDNLEVLRLMQRAYNDRIRLIVIDPPYNTGNDFVYDDDFRDGLGTYLQFTGQADAKGKRTTSNSETGGRYHSNWLSMMYPRLALARNLLRRDGVIFVSIDDHEIHNLRLVMDEVFGPENFLATLVWDRNHSQQAGIFKEYHEYVVAYARDKSMVKTFRDPEGGQIVAGAIKKVSAANPKSEFTFPPGVRCEAPDGTEFVGTWGGAEKTELVAGRFVVEGGVTRESVTLAAGWTQKDQMTRYFAGEEVTDTRGQEVLEFYFSSSGKLKSIKDRSALTPPTVQRWGTQGAASQALADRLGRQTFDYPKPLAMLEDFVAWVCDDGDIVLDLFAGSGTTGEAVMAVNARDGGGRRFVLVQIPEAMDDAEFDTVADIALARLGVAADQCTTGLNAAGCPPGTFGYRTLALAPSNFQIWDTGAVPKGSDELGEQLVAFADTLKDDATDDGVVIEVLLKDGITPDMPIRKVDLSGVSTVVVGDSEVAIALPKSVTDDLVDALIELAPKRAVVREAAFAGNDSVKTNAALRFEEAGIVFRTA